MVVLLDTLLLEEKTTIGGFELKALKKLYGARLSLPFSSTVLTKAIGRGETAPIMYWCRSLVGMVPGVINRFKLLDNF